MYVCTKCQTYQNVSRETFWYNWRKIRHRGRPRAGGAAHHSGEAAKNSASASGASSYRGKLRPWAPSRARMTIAICPEISSAPRIVRPEALHAVGDCVPTWRRAIARSVIAGRRRSIIRARIIIWSGAIIVRRRQCTADHGPGDNCSGHRSTPSPTPTPAPPLHGLDRAWQRILDRKPINSRCSRCGADEPSHARDQ